MTEIQTNYYTNTLTSEAMKKSETVEVPELDMTDRRTSRRSSLSSDQFGMTDSENLFDKESVQSSSETCSVISENEFPSIQSIQSSETYSVVSEPVELFAFGTKRKVYVRDNEGFQLTTIPRGRVVRVVRDNEGVAYQIQTPVEGWIFQNDHTTQLFDGSVVVNDWDEIIIEIEDDQIDVPNKQEQAYLEPDVKHTGRVTQWFADRGFGFITPTGLNSGEQDVFVHVADLQEREELLVGECVSYDVEQNRQTGKWRAVNLAGNHTSSEKGTGSLWIATSNLIVREAFSTNGVRSRYVDTIEKGIEVEVVEFKSNSRYKNEKNGAVRVRIVSPIEGWTDLKVWSRADKKMVTCLKKTASRGSIRAPVAIKPRTAAKRTRTNGEKAFRHYHHVGYVAPAKPKTEVEVEGLKPARVQFTVKNVPKRVSSSFVKRSLASQGIYAVEVRIVGTANSTNKAELTFTNETLANSAEEKLKRTSVKVYYNGIKFVKDTRVKLERQSEFNTQ